MTPISTGSTSGAWKRRVGTEARIFGSFSTQNSRGFSTAISLVPDEQGSGEAKSDIAERHGLRVVRGTIPVPDLRIEYETADGEPARLDLELATEHYRFRNIAQKVRAGFSIYARSQDAPESASRSGPARNHCGDSEFMNIPRNHVELLMEFGYTEPEAQFLYVVATHSGYFILRQYLELYGRTPWKTILSLCSENPEQRSRLRPRLYGVRLDLPPLFEDSLRADRERTICAIAALTRLNSFARASCCSTSFLPIAEVRVSRNRTGQDQVFLRETGHRKGAFFRARFMKVGQEVVQPFAISWTNSHSFLRHRSLVLLLWSPFLMLIPGLGNDLGIPDASRSLHPLFRQLRFVSVSLHIAERHRISEEPRKRFRSGVKKPLESDVSGEVLRYFEVRQAL